MWCIDENGNEILAYIDGLTPANLRIVQAHYVYKDDEVPRDVKKHLMEKYKTEMVYEWCSDHLFDVDVKH